MSDKAKPLTLREIKAQGWRKHGCWAFDSKHWTKENKAHKVCARMVYPGTWTEEPKRYDR